jgi:FtsH-binding integral membrane protein
MSDEKDETGRRAWLKQNVLGLGLGTAAFMYGLIALAMGRAFVPGFSLRDSLLTGDAALAMALAFISGGAYLFLRFFLERRLRKPSTRAQVYMVQVALLVGFIGSLLFVLFKGSEVGGV